jgi:pyruvate dehydrogenase E2 component (dihydrolipoamide acetyltransferase)
MSKSIEIVVPDIGGFNDVPIVEVLVGPGDAIARDAGIVTLESEKATMEVPSTVSGTIADVKVRVGDKVSQGSLLATVTVEDLAETQAPVGSGSTAAVAGGVAPPSGKPSTESAEHALPEHVPPPATSPNGRPPAPQTLARADEAAHASPAIRRFARELGVDLHGVTGSGPNRRITRDDVHAFVKRSLGDGSLQDGATGRAGFGLKLPAWPSIDFAQFGPIERKLLSRIKRISGPILARNWVMIPHVTQHDEADITELEDFRKRLNAEQRDVKVTLLAFLMKAVAGTLQRFPDFNASLAGEELVLKRYYHIGFAADTPEGLVVPVVRDVERKGLLEIARESAELAAKARDGKLALTEMQGGTFTISSLGGIGGTGFTPIVNAPEVAILGVVRAALRPVWDGSAFVPRLMLPLSLSYDHRVVDGAAAARFCVALAQTLGDLRRLLL